MGREDAKRVRRALAGLLLAWAGISQAQVIMGAPPQRSAWRRDRKIPAPVIPMNLDGLAKAPLSGSGEIRVTGQVVTADGGPVAGALVISVVSVQGQLEGGKDHAQVMSADAGLEVLLGPGVWKPSVFASGFTMATTAIKSGDQTAQLV